MNLTQKLSHKEKQVVSVLVQYRALDLRSPTCDDIARVSRLTYGAVRGAVDELIKKNVVVPIFHGGSSQQSRYKLADFGGAGR